MIPYLIPLGFLTVLGIIVAVKRYRSSTPPAPTRTPSVPTKPPPAPAPAAPTKSAGARAVDWIGGLVGLAVLGFLVLAVASIGESCVREIRLAVKENTKQEEVKRVREELARAVDAPVQYLGENKYLFVISPKKMIIETLFVKPSEYSGFHYRAVGQTRDGFNRPWHTAKGFGRPLYPNARSPYPLGPNSSFMQLIARIGEHEKWQGLSEQGSFRIEKAGMLQFSFNYPHQDSKESPRPDWWSWKEGLIKIYVEFVEVEKTDSTSPTLTRASARSARSFLFQTFKNLLFVS